MKNQIAFSIVSVLTMALLLSCSADNDGRFSPDILPVKDIDPKMQQDVVAGNTEFALDLYSRLAKNGDDENLFLSPYSISTALAMTWAGARGDTADQMADTLHFTLPPGTFHPVMGHLQQQLNPGRTEKGYQLHIANALWGQKGYAFLDSFIEINDDYYQAGLNRLDFAGATEQSRKTINAWVEDKTNDKLQDLIKPGVLTPLTRLVLTNAIYFKGKWEHEFDPNRTRDMPFYLSADQTSPAPMMTQRETFGYHETDKLQLLELPYQENELSMIVLLPKKRDGLAAVESALTPAHLKQWSEKLRLQEVLVYLPKFTTTAQFSLKKVLSAMGMPLAFDPDKADFSGMTGNKDLYISAVVHKAFVDVNEEGTEAAAATGVVTVTRAMPTPPKVFRADHPFLFLIRDNRTESILFMGRLMEPEE